MIGQHSGPNFTIPPLIAMLFAAVVLIIYVRIVMTFLEDLYRPERRVAGGDKTVWAVIIIFGSILGILAYLLFGREA